MRELQIKPHALYVRKYSIDLNRCQICDIAPIYYFEFCRFCYKKYCDDFKRPWLQAIRTFAQRERRRANREIEDISLDALFDSMYLDGEM